MLHPICTLHTKHEALSEKTIGGITKIAVPSWGPYYKGMLLLGDLYSGSLLFVILHILTILRCGGPS